MADRVAPAVQCRLCGGIGIRPLKPGVDRNWRKCRRCKGLGVEPRKDTK